MPNARMIAVFNGGVLDPNILNPRLKHLQTGVYYDGTPTGGGGTGIYKFLNYPDGDYVFFDGSSEKGNVLGTETEGGTFLPDNTLPYLKRKAPSGPTFDAEGQVIEAVGDVDEAGGKGKLAMNRDSSDARYIQLDESNIPSDIVRTGGATMTGNLNVVIPTSNLHAMRKDFADVSYMSKIVDVTNDSSATNILRGETFVTQTITKLLHAANKKFVLDELQKVLTGLNPSAFQQSLNIIRVNYSGTQEDNKVYQTIGAAIGIASGFPASAARRVIIQIEGNGAGGEFTDYNLLPTVIDPYIDIVGMNEGIDIVLGDVAYTGTAIGDNEISNAILEIPSSGTPSFDKYIFNNCTFKSDGTGVLTLSNSRVFNCKSERCDVTLASSVGTPIFDITNNVFISSADFQIGGRMLSNRTVLHATGNLVLPTNAGNYFELDSTNTVNFIDTVGWTKGTRITLYCSAGTTTLTHGATPGGTLGTMRWKSGSNKSAVTTEVNSLVLVNNASGSGLWLEN